MKYRHWQKIQGITGFTFDLERPGFCLKDILEAPLLPNKEDIEDVCISALKEKDIEAKLRQVTVSKNSASNLNSIMIVKFFQIFDLSIKRCSNETMRNFLYFRVNGRHKNCRLWYSKTEENFFFEVTLPLKL